MAYTIRGGHKLELSKDNLVKDSALGVLKISTSRLVNKKIKLKF